MKYKRIVMAMFTLAVLLLSGCSYSQEAGRPEENTEDTTQRILGSLGITLYEAYDGVGAPSFNPDTTAGRETFKGFLSYVESKGSGVTFNYDTIEEADAGYSVRLCAPLDGWGNEVCVWFVMPHPEKVDYTILLASPGLDGELSMSGIEDIHKDSSGDDMYIFHTNDSDAQETDALFQS